MIIQASPISLSFSDICSLVRFRAPNSISYEIFTFIFLNFMKFDIALIDTSKWLSVRVLPARMTRTKRSDSRGPEKVDS